MCNVEKNRPPNRWNSSLIKGVFYGLVVFAILRLFCLPPPQQIEDVPKIVGTVYQVPPRIRPIKIKAPERSSVHLSPQFGRGQRDPRASAVRSEPRAQERYRWALRCENTLREKEESLSRLNNYIPFSLQGRYFSLQTKVREVLLSPPSETAGLEILLSRQQDQIVSTFGLPLSDSDPLFSRYFELDAELAGWSDETEIRILNMNQTRREVNSFEEEVISQNSNQPPI